MSKVWFITGTSSGLGRCLTEEVLKHGDFVVATARKPEKLADLVTEYGEKIKALPLDVTNKDEIKTSVTQAVATFGRIDVLVNNAGSGLVGALEEYTDVQIRQNMETNLFGPINMMRAVLPIMRSQKCGHIINMSAIAGFSNELGFSVYGGAKFALEGVSEAVYGEVRPLGIKLTLVEPGPFRTDFIGRSLVRAENKIPDYDKTSGKFAKFLDKMSGNQPGDPQKAAQAIIKVVESRKPTLRLVLGGYAYKKFRQKIAALNQQLEQWEEIGTNTDFA